MTKESEYKLKWKRRRKEEAINLLGGKCQICGYNKCMGALEFHHLDPSKKDMNIGFAILEYKWEKIKPELDKCILICSNCHREVHYKKVPEYELQVFYKPWKKITCPICRKEFETKVDTQIYCSNHCRGYADRKATRPSKDELKKLVDDDTISWLQMGKMFGVSDNAVRKWARKYNLI